MVAFVTGAPGFIGSHVVKELVGSGESVTALVRDPEKAAALKDLNVEFIKGDVTDKNSLAGAMRDCEVVYHLANIYEWWLSDRKLFYRVNVDGTRNVLTTALEEGVDKVVHTSTAGAIFSGRNDQVVNEETQHSGHFIGDYTSSKFLAEREAFRIHREHGLPLVVVNPGAVIGPGDFKATGRLILDFLNRKLPGTFFEDLSLPYVYVKDVAKGQILASKKGRIGERYILSGENITWRDYFRMLSEISGVEVPKRKISPAMAKFVASLSELKSFFTRKPPNVAKELVKLMQHGGTVDNTKSREELGLDYTPIREALTRTVQWYWDNGHAPKP